MKINGKKSHAQNSEKTAVGRPFPSGISGNPGGRPKSEPHMRKRCRDVVDEKVLVAWEAELDDRGPSWVKCSELLAAYGYGKPKDAPREDDGADDQAAGALNALTPEQVRALAAAKLSSEH